MRRLAKALGKILFVAVLLTTAVASAQTPVGNEFRVNSYTTHNQDLPSVASRSNGDFVVVWASNLEDGAMTGIYAQRFASSGAPIGPEFRVNSTTTDGQTSPKVAITGGGFVVVWTSNLQDGDARGIFGRRFSSSGAPAGSEFRVNSYTSGTQKTPAVAGDSAGNFVVLWSSLNQDGQGYALVGQRYASSGAPAGPEFRVNTYTTQNQTYPAAAYDPLGDFVVVWTGPQVSSYDVIGQRYDSSGSAKGGEFMVNTATFSNQRLPSVATDSRGNFVVVWESLQDGSFSYGVYGQRYDSSGVSRGPEFHVNTFTTLAQTVPVVAMDPSGAFVVAWQSSNQDGSYDGAFGQRFERDGTPLGAEFRVNSTTSNVQSSPAIATDDAGNFVIAWSSFNQDNSYDAVFAQRYACRPLSSVSVSAMGSTTVCQGEIGGTATVSDTGGGAALHQWYRRLLPAGGYVAISGETGVSYVIDGADFPAPGSYAVICQTIPACGSATNAPETLTVTITADPMSPTVTPPAGVTMEQTLCQ